MKIGIIGSRRRNKQKDYNAILKVLLPYIRVKSYVHIISGGCPSGGDHFAEIIAKRYGLPITIYYPDWKIGKSAGFFRNTYIAEDSKILIACVASDRKGGTEDTIKKFLAYNQKGKLILV